MGRIVRWTVAGASAVVVLASAACAGGDPLDDHSGDPLDDYLADMRAAGQPADVPDAALIVSGEATCAAVRAGQLDPATAEADDPAALAAAARHCTTAFAQPLTLEQRGRYGVDAWLASTDGQEPVEPGEQGDEGGDGYSERGNTVAAVGEEIESWGPPMAPEPSQWITVTGIEELVGACPASTDRRPVDPPENGEFHRVEMTVRNGPSYDATQSTYYPGTAPDFDYVTSSGAAYDAVDNLTAFYCSGDEAPFYDLKPGRTYTGTVWVDLPAEPGVLILGQNSTLGTGYEFAID